MTSRLPRLCDSCAHDNGDNQTCTSFPAGIPDEINALGGDHRQTIAGEPPYEPDPAARADYDIWLRFRNALQEMEGWE